MLVNASAKEFISFFISNYYNIFISINQFELVFRVIIKCAVTKVFVEEGIFIHSCTMADTNLTRQIFFQIICNDLIFLFFCIMNMKTA